MKIFTLIIHQSCQQDLADTLKTTDFVQSFTLTQIEGHGGLKEKNPILSMKDQVVGYIQKTKADILVEDKNVKDLLDIILTINGIKGQSIYWVSTVEEMEFI